MATLEDLVEECLLNLEGYAADQGIYGTLTSSISETETSFLVDGAIVNNDNSGFSTGLIEVGDELINCRYINTTTGEFSQVIRGFRSSGAVTHDAGELVRNNPKFPRVSIKRAINDTIRQLHPHILAIKKVEFTLLGSQVQYDLPEDANGVISVQVEELGASKRWVDVREWRFDSTGTSNSTTGKTVDIGGGWSGRKVQVVYTILPSDLQSGSDFITTGLPDWTRELVVYGTCWRVASFVESANIVSNTADQQLLRQRMDVGSSTNLAKYFLGMYSQLLSEGEARQRLEFPVRRHFVY
jgi:hypothetical protein